METTTDASLVSKHGLKKIKKRKNPSKSFLEIRNPKIAFQKAIFYWSLISNLFESKKNSESLLSNVLFVQDQQILQLQQNGGIPNLLVRIKNEEGKIRKGQVDFYLLSEEGKVLDLDFHRPETKYRYYLDHLQIHAREINNNTKLAYVILTSPKLVSFNIFSFKQFDNLFISDRSSGLSFCEEIEDDIDIQEKLAIKREEEYWRQIEKRRNNGETIHICPACGSEWNNNYCRYCGHPH